MVAPAAHIAGAVAGDHPGDVGRRSAILMQHMENAALRRPAMLLLSITFSQVFLGIGAYMARVAYAGRAAAHADDGAVYGGACRRGFAGRWARRSRSRMRMRGPHADSGAWRDGHRLMRDYIELTKPRITWLILMSTGIGYFFGLPAARPGGNF